MGEIYCRYALSSEGIFYAEDGDDNKVVFIDKNNGQRKIIVPGIANVYENARPKICKVKYCADKVLLNVYDAPDLVGNYYNIDEKGGWKFQNNFKCEEIQSINGDYILYHTAGGTLEEN